jgi:putative salt-induced outer membrane protein YdiY
MFALLCATLLTQADAAAAAPTAAPPSTEERAALAAERAALAAERAALAAERVANSVAPEAPKEDPAAAAAPPKPDAWTGSGGIGLTYITGNTTSLVLTSNVSADRKWDKWSFGLRLWGGFGLTNPAANDPASTSATTARKAGGSVRGERAFGGGFASIFAMAGSEFDHVKNIESRTIGEAGVGLKFFDQKEGDLEKLFLKLDLGLRAGYETRFQYFPVHAAVPDYGVPILAPRAGVAFRWGFNKWVRFSEEIEFIPYVIQPDAGRLLINNTTKLSSRITENLALTAAVVVNYDSKPPQVAPPPAPQRVTTDVTLTAGIEAVF